MQTWRRKLRIQEMADIAKKELELGTEITQIYEMLDEMMQIRWKSIPTTRRQYLISVKKVLANQMVLVV
ncbi:MAG TPA: hypothetical protein VMW74_10890 [Nitrosopumilaceae archaeon]|nr:hypothetical protein [Nitrosopumilaceae archaeon]